jgi:VanZ family protein
MNRFLPLIVVLSFISSIVYVADMRLCPRLFSWVAAMPHLDKVMHCLLMGTLAWVANIALKHHRLSLGSTRLLTGSCLIWVIVSAEEYSQQWFPARSSDPWDLLADSIGIMLAGLLSPATGQTARQAAL